MRGPELQGREYEVSERFTVENVDPLAYVTGFCWPEIADRINKVLARVEGSNARIIDMDVRKASYFGGIVRVRVRYVAPHIVPQLRGSDTRIVFDKAEEE